MNVATMRTLDRLLGVPLCWLTGVAMTVRSISTPVESEKPRSILVIKFFGMGSVLLTSPFLKALQHTYPSARLLFLTFSSNREILEKLPFAMERLTVRTTSIGAFLRDTCRVLWVLWRRHIDIVFDLEFFSKYSTLISVLTGASLRIGYDLPTFWRAANITHHVLLDRSSHVTRIFLRQLAALELDIPDDITLPHLQPTPDEDTSMRRKLNLGTNGIQTIVVNINAGETSLERRWPPDRFLEVAEHLIRENPARRLFFTGTRQERGYVQRVLDRYVHLGPHLVNCAGWLTIGEFIALLDHSRMFITNDSGPMHIAAATGVPTVALFGPESPHFYGPLGESRIVYEQLPCSPCLNMYTAKLFVCPYDARCMKELSVNEVLESVRSLYARQHVSYS